MANGFFQGGFAEGQQVGRELNLQERALEVDTKAKSDESLRKTRTELTNNSNAILKTVDDLIAEMKANNVPDDRIVKTVRPLVLEAAQGLSMVGGNPQAALDRVMARIAATPTGTQTAQVEGASAAESQISQANTLIAAGVPSGSAQEAAGIAPQTISRIVSGSTLFGQNMGIPQGENARVEFDVGANGTLVNPQIKGRFGAGQDITVEIGPRQREFEKKLGEANVKQINRTIDEGLSAVTAEQSLLQMMNLITSAELQTGTIPQLTTGLQNLAQGLGVDLRETAQRTLGIDIGDLASKQQFNRLATELVVESFEKFKGNLNQREVELALDAFAQLGTSFDANVDAIAAGIAAAELAKERGLLANNAQIQGDPALAAEILKSRFEEGSGDRFLELKARVKEKILTDIGQAREGATQQPDIGGLTMEQIREQGANAPAFVNDFVNSATIEQIDDLDPEVRRAIRDILQQNRPPQ